LAFHSDFSDKNADEFISKKHLPWLVGLYNTATSGATAYSLE